MLVAALIKKMLCKSSVIDVKYFFYVMESSEKIRQSNRCNLGYRFASIRYKRFLIVFGIWTLL